MKICFAIKSPRSVADRKAGESITTLDIDLRKDLNREERDLLADRLFDRAVCELKVTHDGIVRCAERCWNGVAKQTAVPRRLIQYIQAARPNIASLKAAIRRNEAKVKAGLRELRALRLRILECHLDGDECGRPLSSREQIGRPRVGKRHRSKRIA